MLHPLKLRLLFAVDPCTHIPCGAYAECSAINDTAVCSCLPGYTGNPYFYCEGRVETMKRRRLNTILTTGSLVHCPVG